MKLSLTERLFHATRKDIYFAEKKILGALPKMAKAAQSEELKARLRSMAARRSSRSRALSRFSNRSARRPRTCDAIMGLLDEGKEIMDEYKDMPALDARLLAAAQAVEHYEISRYGSLKCWASELGYNDAVQLLVATLTEEKNSEAIVAEDGYLADHSLGDPKTSSEMAVGNSAANAIRCIAWGAGP